MCETMAICSQCGERKFCTLTIDPFMDEVYEGEDTDENWWCEDCYDSRAGDI